MYEKDQQVYPLAPANGHPRSDREAAITAASKFKEMKRKKKIKCAVYVAALALFQAAIILTLALTIMKIRNPKVRLGAVTIENMQTLTSPSPSFNIKLSAQVTVKNTNFGHYKFEGTNITFLYQGLEIGQATVPGARARARSTKKLQVPVELNSANLGTQLGSDVFTLNSEAKFSGEVELMKLIKKNKSAQMNCTIAINVSTRMIRDLSCK